MLGVAPAPGDPAPRTLQEVKHALTGLPLDVCEQMTESFLLQRCEPGAGRRRRTPARGGMLWRRKMGRAVRT